ncbi:MAG: hypothetical protein OEU09_08980 [Rhodospirillales bacterium]|nr:hypothetical protein [Rhodospirillales bacterium]MDH3792794.1 hypothetical protein [Rhodospirillales bacterium]MDH3911417.1 hypothetical protein [Rhodospirillales bacterium]MDH3919212.1 hypothetical protein [Rhodospirillales bacterium]MDH3968667.1 hypothetical protein [Rhodospirillales bacterium]
MDAEDSPLDNDVLLVEAFDWRAPETLITFGAVALGLGVIAAALVHIVVLRILDLDPAAVSSGEEMLAVILISLLLIPFVLVLYDLTKTTATRRQAATASIPALGKISGFKQFVLSFVLTCLVALPVFGLEYTAFGEPLHDMNAIFIEIGAFGMGAGFGQMLVPRFLLRWGQIKAPVKS